MIETILLILFISINCINCENICSKDLKCVPFVQCPAHIRNEIKKSCTTSIGREGICCSSGQNHTEKGPHHRHHIARMNSHMIDVLASYSKEKVHQWKMQENLLFEDGLVVSPGSPSYDHFKNFKITSKIDLEEVMDLASRAMEIAVATKNFKDRQSLSNDDIELGMLEQDLSSTVLGVDCAPKPYCPPVLPRYRSIDGACNNLKNPSWGTAMTPYARLLPASYSDGIWQPRISVTGHHLTSPRKISTTLISDNDDYNYDYTLMVMQFGQFISHDITQSIENSFTNGSAISCCSNDGRIRYEEKKKHYACYAIDVPNDDPFYSKFNKKCINFVRSVLAPRQDCTLGYAQQMNKITHFIDGSSIYGSSSDQTGKLRQFDGGLLRTFSDFGRPMLPLSEDPDQCLSRAHNSACYMSGDTRVNQMITLAVLHTIFVREHNRIAIALSKLNPHFNDEQLFLEARRIVTAELQVIVYKEFLPIIIGEAAMDEFHLRLGKGMEYSNDYDPKIEPSATNEFASAAFRFGHSIVNGILKIYGKQRMEEMIFIPEIMFQPNRLRKFFFMDELLSTLTTEPIQHVDNNLDEALTRYMFRAGNAFGIDLAALNVQRGRDHGLRPYNDYRELIGLPRITKFEELNPKLSEKLKSVYASVNDIDLWIGGLLEQPAPDSIVGYTFRDIIADQFYRLKKGDRYFFENNPQINPGYFTPEQLQELRKTSMSRLVCDNSDGSLIARQGLNAFRKPGVKENPFIDCDSSEIPRINLGYWKNY